MQATQAQLDAIRRICAVIIEAVKEAGPLGAPAGIVYAALSTAGCTLDQFNQFMAGLVRAGKLRKDGDCYHAI